MTYALPANPEFVAKLHGVSEPMSYLSLEAAEAAGFGSISRLPRTLKVMAEDILFRLPAPQARAQISALITRAQTLPVSFAPGRALLQDFMGIPLMTDMASMRDALAEQGRDPVLLDPAIPVDFVVDHSLNVLFSGNPEAYARNQQAEFERNAERFAFIKWCQQSFSRFRVIPPGRGIMHQVNLEWLSHVVTLNPDTRLARPDTMIGTDSHTTMVNALGVLGWGVGGIEAETAMLGTPLEMGAPRIVGIRLTGVRPAGTTATDLVLHVAEKLRAVGVVGAFLEFHGAGVSQLPLADRATIANMAPEYGATCAWFPIDGLTLEYLRMTGRDARHLARVRAYAQAQGLWQDPETVDTVTLDFDEEHIFDLSQVVPSMAGPTRPDQRVALCDVPSSFDEKMREIAPEATASDSGSLDHGAVVIAAITSCTNTSNPEVMIAAGLLARKARAAGLSPRPWVKTSLTPGSRVVTDYLTDAGLMADLEALGFHNVGYGCATCNGNSGPLAPDIQARIERDTLCTVGVLSGNRNFEGRIHPQIKGAYLASPLLVIAAALAGSVTRDLTSASLGTDPDGNPVFLADIWPDAAEISAVVAQYVTAERFQKCYASGMETTDAWDALKSPQGVRFPWDDTSSFIRPSPFPTLDAVLDVGRPENGRIDGIRPLLMLGDAITTDHISPNGAIRTDSPAGRYLQDQGTDPGRLGNFGTRRGNPEICLRGMFDNSLLNNELVTGTRGNHARHAPSGRVMTVYEVCESYRQMGTPLIIIAGRNYGQGSSRDWAAKGLTLMGVRAVLAESFERIHRTNLVGMGILPLTFPVGMTRHDLGVTDDTVFALEMPRSGLHAHCEVILHHDLPGSSPHQFVLTAQIASESEVHILSRGGLLPHMMAKLMAA